MSVSSLLSRVFFARERSTFVPTISRTFSERAPTFHVVEGIVTNATNKDVSVCCQRLTESTRLRAALNREGDSFASHQLCPPDHTKAPSKIKPDKHGQRSTEATAER